MSSTRNAAVHGTVTSADRAFLRQLQRRGPQAISQLCEMTGVTPNAVRQRLNRLLDEGFVSRQTITGNRGRPYHEYQVSAAGQQELGDDYATLAKHLWREVLRLDDGDVRQQLLGGLRQAMVDRYQPRTPLQALPDRVQQLGESLDREGFDVETVTRQNGGETLPILREYHCPYHELAAEDRTICELEQSVFEEVLGVPVTLTQCCHDGHNCCEFEPAIHGETVAEATVGKDVTKR